MLIKKNRVPLLSMLTVGLLPSVLKVAYYRLRGYRIGRRVRIGPLAVVIADDTGIGGHCLLFTHGSWQPQTDGYPVAFAPITLGRNVWLPWRVFIMPGVSVGDGTTIGANSLVTKDLPAHCLAAGSPAKVLRGPEDLGRRSRSEEHTSELQSPCNLVCRLLLEKKKNTTLTFRLAH